MKRDRADTIETLERIAASAIASNAAMKCIIAGKELTADNIISLVGDFCDPSADDVQGLIVALELAIDALAAAQSTATRVPTAANTNSMLALANSSS